MLRSGVLLWAFVVPVATAAAESVIEPGQWKVTSMTVMDGAATQPQVKTRCLSAEQTGDIGKTFGPEFGTMNSTCERTLFEASGRTLKWRLQCKGQLDLDVSVDFNFDTPLHYTATVTAKGWMAGMLISAARTELEGERVSACEQ